MTLPHPGRQHTPERRLVLDRRSGEERRAGNAGPGPERRDVERRSGADRRAAIERRLSLQSAEDQIHGALRLLTFVSDAGGPALGEQQRRGLEAAMLRLRFALERLEEG